MPKVHNIGKQHFVQVIKLPVEWGNKIAVRGWTQEIEEPFRTSTPLIVRLPNYRALVLGKWSGSKTEEEALNAALQRRDVTYDDFTEEAGWTPAPDQDRETSVDDIDSGPGDVDGAGNVHDWQTYYRMAKAAE
jgi:hypothetical protein